VGRLKLGSGPLNLQKTFEPGAKIKGYHKCRLTPKDLARFIALRQGDNWTPGSIVSSIQALQYEGRSFNEISEEFRKAGIRQISFNPFYEQSN